MELDEERFIRDLQAACREGGRVLRPAETSGAVIHARLIAQWSRHVNLTASADASELARRHHAEGFLAAGLLPPAEGLRVVDIGAGAGFPGVPMAMARPDIALTAVEPRERRAAFLSAVARALPELRMEVLCTRWEALIGRRWDVITMRALALTPASVRPSLEPGGLLLLFMGPNMDIGPWLAAGFSEGDCMNLPGSGRSIQALLSHQVVG